MLETLCYKYTLRTCNTACSSLQQWWHERASRTLPALLILAHLGPKLKKPEHSARSVQSVCLCMVHVIPAFGSPINYAKIYHIHLFSETEHRTALYMGGSLLFFVSS